MGCQAGSSDHPGRSKQKAHEAYLFFVEDCEHRAKRLTVQNRLRMFGGHERESIEFIFRNC